MKFLISPHIFQSQVLPSLYSLTYLLHAQITSYISFNQTLMTTIRTLLLGRLRTYGGAESNYVTGLQWKNCWVSRIPICFTSSNIRPVAFHRQMQLEKLFGMVHSKYVPTKIIGTGTLLVCFFWAKPTSSFASLSIHARWTSPRPTRRSR